MTVWATQRSQPNMSMVFWGGKAAQGHRTLSSERGYPIAALLYLGL